MSFRVLLTESDRDYEAHFKTIVRRYGIEASITVARSAPAARDALRTGRFDAIVLDIDSIVGENGERLIKSITDLSRMAPLIVLTDTDDLDALHDVLQAGATDFSVKSGRDVDIAARLLANLTRGQLTSSKMHRSARLAREARSTLLRVSGFSAAPPMLALAEHG